ncbi:threonine--tRNA ligase [Sporosarcina sp. BI001-red]|uniref:threonine--tRNA ligase n=1 Tax=Sporosarcina sp. BI001-red TaxID=2282866 RepID=UPI000E24C12E|nr:threonine--tRNA ligase [Sporosarcina sp. BI001-red]REB07082.1 threonine--tRNA ligase [Sporosarcina sp. BI001-red]
MSIQSEEEIRNHRKLGQELELFMASEEAPGMPFYLPNGMILRNALEDYWRKEHRKAGYEEIKTPIMMKQELWETSGHWDHYQDNMYFSEVDNQKYALKPMNCPGAMLIYNHKRRSYRELPIRYAELGLVHRHELSGSLNGLLRVRAFTQDDAHLFVREDQIEPEIDRVLDLIHDMYSKFGFRYEVELSTRPENFMGSVELWDEAEQSLENVLKERGMPYTLNEGDGAFYGPKIDFHILDSLGRSWQCGTVQLDFQMPQKFNCQYVGEDNSLHHPIIIHRAVFGSMERFLAILIEHYEGAFPLWLAPEQIRILPIADVHLDYAFEVKRKLNEKGYRAEVDDRSEKFGYRVRDAAKAKIPFAWIVGDKEVENQGVSVRKRKEGDLGQLLVEAALNLLEGE